MAAISTLPVGEHPALGPSEWLLTNGLGGFSLGCADGIPRRRYHAWLVGAARPPLGRVVALHSAAEWLLLYDDAGKQLRLDLSTYQFRGAVQSPAGARFLTRFERTDDQCIWEYHFPSLDVTVRRTLYLFRLRNAISVTYDVSAGGRGATLQVRPFTPMRDFHALSGEHPASALLAASPGDHPAEYIIGPPGDGALRLHAPGAAFIQEPQWWRAFEYSVDHSRAQEAHEDLPSPGIFSWQIPPGGGAASLGARTDADPPPAARAPDIAERARLRAATLGHALAHAPAAPRDQLRTLLIAADQFIVRRLRKDRGHGASIIAGYPWFSDWGRDTCIALPGLLIATGRLDEARQVLEAFAELREGGLVPNCFDDGSGAAQFNTVDASLWYLHAACVYARATGGHIGSPMIEACLDIIAAYEKGTAFGISMDPQDGLIRAGDESTQLTWMDAKRDGTVFTPRHGKPVEISALWYSGMLELASVLPAGMSHHAKTLRETADWVGRNFCRTFWNEEGRCLHDCIVPRFGGNGHTAWEPCSDVRPNQIFAISLPHSPLSIEQRRAVLACVRDRLLTPLGLRTLDPADPKYRPRYEGSMFDRDRAYHNGTVWPWLIGPYAEAVLRVGGFTPDSRREAAAALAPLLMQVSAARSTPGPVAQLAEIYDAEEPRRPQGCPAQAWSVAEVLRVLLLVHGTGG
ncbi:MAG: glycogen debranching enzyme family protein [Phycisphaeraceae bacterium]|nr:glycogen debranching enzyme family protein [Phycisphaeraceae bacterium]